MDDEIVEINAIESEEGSEELVSSPDMQPYLRLLRALLSKQPLPEATQELASLPLEKRYLWRVVSALKWAFCDFDNLCVTADRITLSEADMEKVLNLLEFRPVQFCMLLKALVGEEEMERMMRNAMETAKEWGARPNGNATPAA